MEQLGWMVLGLNTFWRNSCLQCCAVCLPCGVLMACHEPLPAQLVDFFFFNLLVYHTGTMYLQLCSAV